MGEVLQFKKQKEPMQKSVNEMWGKVKKTTYNKLLPRGISQDLADDFLNKFEPIFLSLIPPNFVLQEVQESDPNYSRHLEVALNAQEQINDYVFKIIGNTFYRELTYFVDKELYRVKEGHSEKT